MNKNTGNITVKASSLNTLKKRNSSVDIIRILAFCNVVLTHFFIFSGFYDTEMVGPTALFMSIIRSFGVTCVPLFMLMTGFLMNKKQLSMKYYSGIKSTLGAYFYASIICYVYNCLSADETMSVAGFTKDLFSFSAAKYSWYIEMYIGLFVLIPFLNIIWNNLPSKKHRLALIGTLCFLAMAPQSFNIFVFNVEGWWKQPSMSNAFTQIFPDYWIDIYPVMYYFIGCYIKEYGIKINKWLNLVLIVGLTAFFGYYCYYRSSPGFFLKGGWQKYSSILLAALAILIFVFILNLNVKFRTSRSRKWSRALADLCLAAYLVSYAVDSVIYAAFNELMPVTEEKYKWITLIVVVPINIVVSFVFAFIINKVTKISLNGLSKITQLIGRAYASAKPRKADETEEEAEEIIELLEEN